MKLLRSILATTTFELRNSIAPQRILVAAVLALFPPAMVTVVRLTDKDSIPASDLLILTLTAIVGILALLLWATPNVYSELEARSWSFVASRPGGRIALFLGKYLSAVILSFSVCFTAIFLCLVSRTFVPPISMLNPVPTIISMSASALLGCVVYAAVFSLIGTFFQKRAMVFAAAYVILSEVILANVPAIVNCLTARFHLQAVAASWVGWFLPWTKEHFVLYYDSYSTTFHLSCLLGAVIVLLIAGCVVISTRQYITADDSS